MRPVNKGDSPRDYYTYNEAKDDLRNILGTYCSYCEMNISNQPDIEHVSPKSKNHKLETDWNNLLLACKTCNGIKSNNNQDRRGYIFPDTDNTASAYKYTKTKITINKSLSKDKKKLAAFTHNLIKLNRKKDSKNRIDDRQFARLTEWEKAVESLDDYIVCNTPEMKRQIGRSPSGFFSSWLEIFKDYPEVKEEILKNVKGSAMDCYDRNFNILNSLDR